MSSSEPERIVGVPDVTPGALTGLSPAGDTAWLADVGVELGRDLAAIERTLAAAVGPDETRIDNAARHGLLGGGKRVRPLLTCAVLRALGQDPTPWIDLVVAVEMAHAGSLLHDDVIDESPTRRDRPTGHVAFDVPTAVLAGDRLVVLAVEQLARRGPREMLVGLCGAVQALCLGESLERERRYDTTVRLDHARRVNRLKTASLFAYASEAGAILANAPSHLRIAARDYGLALGEAFQTTDDRLDLCGESHVMGKPIGQDLVAGVISVPVAIALEHPALRDELLGVWRAPGHDERWRYLHRLRDGMKQAGAFSATLRLAAADAARAAAAIRALPAGPWRDRMVELTGKIVRRVR